MSKKKAKTAAQLAEACATDLQLLVRLKAADDNGYCQCWTCQKIDHYKQMQGGHFIERGRTATKLVEENIHPQCPYCNLRKMKTASGVLLYRGAMVDMYGEDAVKALELLSRETNKWNREDIAALHADIREQIRYHQDRVGG